ncbi:MAG: methyltransferase [Pseudomonadota bacterium]
MTLATQAEEISNIAFGYMASKALFCALELGVFTALADEPQTAGALAERLGAAEGPLETLLTALSAARLVALEDGVWVNSPAADSFLTKGAKYDFGDYLRLQVGRQMEPLMDQLEGVVRSAPAPEGTNSYADWFSDPEEARLYSQSQHAGSLGPARQLARRVPLEDARHLLDVGGGTGAFAITLAKAFPDLSVTVVEFETVAALGRDYVAAEGLSDRIRYVEGDGREAVWPEGQDAVLMSYLFSGVPGPAHGDLMARAFAHLRPGGRYLVHDFVVNEARTGPPLAALWQLQHTAFTPGARSLDEATLRAELSATGFGEVAVSPMIPGLTMLAEGVRPAA